MLLGYFLEAYRDFTCVDCDAYTARRREESISGFDYIIILYGAMFDFALTVLKHSIDLLNLQSIGD